MARSKFAPRFILYVNIISGGFFNSLAFWGYCMPGWNRESFLDSFWEYLTKPRSSCLGFDSVFFCPNFEIDFSMVRLRIFAIQSVRIHIRDIRIETFEIFFHNRATKNNIFFLFEIYSRIRNNISKSVQFWYGISKKYSIWIIWVIFEMTNR